MAISHLTVAGWPAITKHDDEPKPFMLHIHTNEMDLWLHADRAFLKMLDQAIVQVRDDWKRAHPGQEW
jgi:hypothetical protein